MIEVLAFLAVTAQTDPLTPIRLEMERTFVAEARMSMETALSQRLAARDTALRTGKREDHLRYLLRTMQTVRLFWAPPGLQIEKRFVVDATEPSYELRRAFWLVNQVDSPGAIRSMLIQGEELASKVPKDVWVRAKLALNNAEIPQGRPDRAIAHARSLFNADGSPRIWFADAVLAWTISMANRNWTEKDLLEVEAALDRFAKQPAPSGFSAMKSMARDAREATKRWRKRLNLPGG